MSETKLSLSPAVEPSAENQRVITYAQAGVEGVREEMRRNPDIFLYRTGYWATRPATSSRAVDYGRNSAKRGFAIHPSRNAP